MPTNNPTSSIQFNTWLSPNANTQNNEGLLLAQYLKGGYQNMITLEDRDAIPIYLEGGTEPHAGFTSSGDEGKTTGRRSLGMMIKVLDPEGDGSVESKVYVLIPYGYFGNNGNLGWDTWFGLPEWEKAKRMKPSATVYTDTSDGGFGYLEYTLPEPQTENDCWVELIQFTEHPLPSGGAPGDVLAKIDNDDQNVGWVSPQSGAQGEAGIQGAQGDPGTQGAQGDPGTQGANGSLINNDLGVVLDFQNNTGLILDGDVTVNEGDTFRVILSPDDTGPTSRLSGYFVANQSFIFTQQTSAVMAVNELLTDMEFFDSISLDGINGSDGVQGSTPVANEFIITVASTPGGNRYFINGIETADISLIRGFRYTFDLTDTSNSTHPFRLSETVDGTGGEYTTGVTIDNDILTFDVPNDAPQQLYYYCTNHTGMGGSINTFDLSNYGDSDVNAFLNGNLDGHIIPDTNATYDIGSAEYKIRHLYLSDNSVYFGDAEVPLNSEKVLNTLNFNIDPNIPAPASHTDLGIKGDVRFDLTYMYICVEENQWKRVALDNSWLS